MNHFEKEKILRNVAWVEVAKFKVQTRCAVYTSLSVLPLTCLELKCIFGICYLAPWQNALASLRSTLLNRLI